MAMNFKSITLSTSRDQLKGFYFYYYITPNLICLVIFKKIFVLKP